MKIKKIKTLFEKHPNISWGATFLILPPVAAYGMWKHTCWSKWLKITLSVYTTIWTISVFFPKFPQAKSNEPLTNNNLSPRNMSMRTPNQAIFLQELVNENLIVPEMLASDTTVGLQESREYLVDKGIEACYRLNQGKTKDEVKEFVYNTLVRSILRIPKNLQTTNISADFAMHETTSRFVEAADRNLCPYEVEGH